MKYSKMTDIELISLVTEKLSPEQIAEINNLSIGLKPKADMLDEVKKTLTKKYPDIREELVELKLAKALALAKKLYQSSLHIVDGHLAVIKTIHMDDELDKLNEKEYKNFLFMANLKQSVNTLEVMVLEQGLRKVMSISSNILLDLEPELIVEIKKRINGEKPLPDNALDNVIF